MAKSGLDLDAPRSGRAADAYAVACTAVVLSNHAPCRDDGAPLDPAFAWARHAVALHRISGQLHRLSERACNEDLTCPNCGGDGETQKHFKSKEHGGKMLPLLGDHNRTECPSCAGDGRTIGKRLARLRQQAKDIAEHYGLRCYFQTDPRGCSLYLIDPAVIPASYQELNRYVYESERKRNPTADIPKLQVRWIEANYTRGHAVGRIGR